MLIMLTGFEGGIITDVKEFRNAVMIYNPVV